MKKYVFAYDTHFLNETRFTHDTVRKIVINFLLDHGVLTTDIKEPLQTTFTFKSNLNTDAWIRFLNIELIPAFNEMMEDQYYYFGSIKPSGDNAFYELVKANPTLQRNLNVMIQEIVRERGNR